jgi:hypothetical protein
VQISVNVYDDPRVAGAIEATGRKKLIFAGLSLEVCARRHLASPSCRHFRRAGCSAIGRNSGSGHIGRHAKPAPNGRIGHA